MRSDKSQKYWLFLEGNYKKNQNSFNPIVTIVHGNFQTLNVEAGRLKEQIVLLTPEEET